MGKAWRKGKAGVWKAWGAEGGLLLRLALHGRERRGHPSTCPLSKHSGAPAAPTHSIPCTALRATLLPEVLQMQNTPTTAPPEAPGLLRGPGDPTTVPVPPPWLAGGR